MSFNINDIFPEKDLKEVWARTDNYFQFRYKEYTTFGSRLKKWRELNNISQMEMAETIYNYRHTLGIEDDDISSEVLPEEAYNSPYSQAVDFETVAKLAQKKLRRITSIYRGYHKWESKETDSSYSDTPFSMTNLRILKEILHCDYEFLFCEIDTPHKGADILSDQIGLNVSSIEKLISFNENSDYYTDNIFVAINKLLSDDDLMAYLSYYLTNIDASDTEDMKDPDNIESFGTISYNLPSAGIISEDSILDGDDKVLGLKDIHFVYLITLANKLNILQSKNTSDDTDYYEDLPQLDNLPISEDGDSFGERLRKWREYNHYSQSTVAERIYNFRNEHNLSKSGTTKKAVVKESILRTYQNWESKNTDNKEVRLSMTDLFVLKNVMGCDYEYLFGEINTITKPACSLYKKLGLNNENTKKLEDYTKSFYEKVEHVPAFARKILDSIDLIISDSELLIYLTTYLTDIPVYANMNLCEILRPISIVNLNIPSESAYNQYLFTDQSLELKNLVIPEILRKFQDLRKKNIYNKQPIFDSDE